MQKRKARKWKLLTTISILVGILTAMITAYIPTSTTSFNTLYIDRQSENQNSAYFTYEGLYSQQTAERFTDTIKGLLTSNNLIGETLERDGIANTKKNRKLFAQKLSVKKTGPQVLTIRLKGNYYKELDPLLLELTDYINTINQQTQKGIVIKTISSPSVTENNDSYPLLNGLVAALILIFTGGIIIEGKSLIKNLT